MMNWAREGEVLLFNLKKMLSVEMIKVLVKVIMK